MGAGVGEILALDIDPRAAEVLRQPFGVGDGGGPADEGAQEIFQLGLELLVALGFEIDFFQLVQGGHERFGHELAAVGAEVAGFVGIGGVVDRGGSRGGLGCGHGLLQDDQVFLHAGEAYEGPAISA